MGNDGGDLPKRKQLVKQKKKQERASSESIAMGRARFCNLTNQKLKQPLAIDRLGCIYNYENIIESLLQKNLPDKYAYIKKLSDIKKVQIEKSSKESQNYFLCPITKLEYNGFNKFVGIWTCGHILSRKAFKEVKIQGDAKKCIICDAPYQEQKDIVDLNLEGEQLEILRKILIEKKNKKNGEKLKDKKQIDDIEKLGLPEKKLKIENVINSIDRLGGEFRDVLRDRTKFKEIFTKEVEQEWKQNTYFVKKLQ